MHVCFHTMATSTSVASKSASVRRGAPIREREFLLFVGTRVRELRNRRGMTRKMAAQEADVSERHLAQLESGEGNISILLLRRIAAVLSVSLEELFAPQRQDNQQGEQQHASQKQTLLRFIERLPSHRLEEAAARLMRDFGPEQNLRLSLIALIGLRGAGKSTLGSKLAADCDVPFIELDHEF